MSEVGISCKEVEPLLDAYLDGELDGAQRPLIERHLATCQPCQAKLEEIRKLVSLLGSLPHLRPPRDIVGSMPDVIESKSKDNLIRLRRFVWPSIGVAAAAIVVALAARNIIGSSSQETLAVKPASGVAGTVTASKTGLAEKLAANSSGPSGRSSPGADGTARALLPDAGLRQPVRARREAKASVPGSASGAGNGAGATAPRSRTSSEPANLALNSPAEPAGVKTAERRKPGQAAPFRDSDDAARDSALEVAVLDEVVRPANTGVGLSTDEDGLYAIEM